MRIGKGPTAKRRFFENPGCQNLESMLSSPMALHCPDSMTAVAGFFNGMTPAKLEQLGDIYGPGVEFRDSIQSARGLTQLRDALAERFKKAPGISFHVLDAHGDDHTGFLLWSMKFPNRGNPKLTHGMSHFRFAPDGRVCEQIDQWDASLLFPNELPVLGWLIKKIKR